MKKLFSTLITAFTLICPLVLAAQEINDTAQIRMVIDSIQKSFQWQTGTIELSNGIATIEVPKGFRYLNGDQSEMVLTEFWGNPSGQNSLGMLFPISCGPLEDDCFAFNITYDAIGYVKDADADKIDYKDLLKNMQKEAIRSHQSTNF
jgi:uncharacterized membrane-anchored protein